MVVLTTTLGIVFFLASLAVLDAAQDASLRFSVGDHQKFTFDTGVLRGKLRAAGRSTGLSSVVFLPTGVRLDASMGLLGHYRVFTTNKRYGTAAWDWPSEARLADDGSVQVRWPATTDRPFELHATYRLAAPNAVDLETSVEAKADLPHFESFVASYFTSSFTNSAVDAGKGESFLTADQSAGVWQAFPRDAAAVGIIKDGRWKLQPNPVDWVIRPELSRPLAYRRCPADGLTAAVMSPPGDCFGVLTPHQTELHHSLYLSLFGRDLKAGETARAHIRLLVMVDPAPKALRSSYAAYIQGSTARN